MCSFARVHRHDFGAGMTAPSLFVHIMGAITLQGKRSVKSSQVTPVTAADAKLVHSAASSARTILTLETAMSLYGLTDSESFWEMKQDTRCLVSWGGRHVVVAFRGTASMKNALADLQVIFFCDTITVIFPKTGWVDLATCTSHVHMSHLCCNQQFLDAHSHPKVSCVIQVYLVHCCNVGRRQVQCASDTLAGHLLDTFHGGQCT